MAASLIENVGASKSKAKPFDTMNNIVANVLLNMTSSSRFEGDLNIDINGRFHINTASNQLLRSSLLAILMSPFPFLRK